jgi:DNA mismatch repair protein MutS
VRPTPAEHSPEVPTPSLLHRRPGPAPAPGGGPAPACFGDLNLDQVVAAIVKGRGWPGLRQVFHRPLREAAEVQYRHEVFRDLGDERLRAAFEAFVEALADVHEHMRRAEAIRNAHQRRRLHFDGATAYCRAVIAVSEALAAAAPRSEGLQGVARYLDGYLASAAFRGLREDVARVGLELDGVRYGLTILDDRVRVGPASNGEDYREAVERTFRRFRHRPTLDRPLEHGVRIDMNHVEASILELVTRLHPEPFASLEAFARRHPHYVDDGVARFAQEAQFYLAYLDFVARFAPTGLGFCLPEVSEDDKAIGARDAFDVALALRLARDGGRIVPNDLELDGRERILVVTGPNQGGKTTFARMVGQLHYLAALGCPVPGSAARLFLCDELLTHFDQEEDLRTLQGKLQEELTRLRALLERASGRTIVIMNEAFSSTAPDDARFLGSETLGRLLELDALCVFVTFIEELATLDERVASVTAMVDPADPSRRTFQVLRRQADGHAYALAVAEAHGLTYDALRLRLRS